MKRRAKAVLIGGIALVSACVIRYAHQADVAKEAEYTASHLIAPAALREVYPAYKLSIVKGGIHSWQQFADAQAKDEVVRKHYAGLVYMERRTLEMNRAFYVSYRRGGKTYGTKHMRLIPMGEHVTWVGDGYLRDRCGNRLSTTPILPVEAENKQPTEAELDTVEGEIPAQSSTDQQQQPDTHIPEGLPIAPLSDDTPRIRVQNAAYTPGGAGGALAPLALAGLGGAGVASGFGTSGTGGFVAGAPIVAVAVAPEPKTWGDVIFGAAIIGMFARVRRKAK